MAGSRRTEHKKSLARKLRVEATETERKLWSLLRSKAFGGVRFRRQQPIGPYVVDFYCASAKPAVELDGGQHSEKDNLEYDAARTQFLNNLGCQVIRFSNRDFIQYRDAVLEGIWRAVKERAAPLPDPPLADRPSLKGRVE